MSSQAPELSEREARNLLPSGRAAAGVEQREFGGMELVGDHEAAALDLPQALPDAETGQERLLGAGQPESAGGRAEPSDSCR